MQALLGTRRFQMAAAGAAGDGAPQGSAPENGAQPEFLQRLPGEGLMSGADATDDSADDSDFDFRALLEGTDSDVSESLEDEEGEAAAEAPGLERQRALS